MGVTSKRFLSKYNCISKQERDEIVNLVSVHLVTISCLPQVVPESSE